MTPTEREAIEKDAIKYVIQETGYQVLPEHEHWKNAYIAGATAEHERNAKLISSLKDEVTYLTATGSLMIDSDDQEKMANHIYQLQKQIKEARNQAIQDCIDKLSSYRDIDRTEMKQELEQLKTKP